MRRLKVLVSAYACNPFKGSEEGVGWGWVKTIAEHHDLWVIAADYHRDDIERAAAENSELFTKLHFCYVPNKPWHYKPTKGWLFIEGSVLKPIMNLAYSLWQRDAFKLGEQLHREIGFNLVHQLTYVGFRFPGQLWKLNIPFVWGPIGGLENTPWRFLPMMGIGGAFYYAGRNVINSLQLMFLPGPKKAFRKAHNNIIAATEGIRREILRWYSEDSQVMCEIGPPQNIAAQHSLRGAGESLKITWSGLHLPGKALPLLLTAIAQLPKDINWALDILGDGPCTRKWQEITENLGIAERCCWHGRLPRSEALALVRQSHVFVITSLKDLTSTVLLEALSQGVPVICPDHCGFSNVVTADCGIKVPVDYPKQLSAAMAVAIAKLEHNEPERRRLAAGALMRSVDFTWDKKAMTINTLYNRAVNLGC